MSYVTVSKVKRCAKESVQTYKAIKYSYHTYCKIIFITYLATALFLLRAVGARLLQARFTFSDGTFGFAVIILSAEVMI